MGQKDYKHPTMERRHIYITSNQAALIEADSSSTGLRWSEIVRRIFDSYYEQKNLKTGTNK